MALKLIHTADWHLGQTFFGYDREAEHEAFLGFLTNLLVERETDVLLIAGDVFDVTNPSAGVCREGAMSCGRLDAILAAKQKQQ